MWLSFWLGNVMPRLSTRWMYHLPYPRECSVKNLVPRDANPRVRRRRKVPKKRKRDSSRVLWLLVRSNTIRGKLGVCISVWNLLHVSCEDLLKDNLLRSASQRRHCSFFNIGQKHVSLRTSSSPTI